MKVSAYIIIPVRYGSKRFPGKPLKLINGKTLVERVYNIGKKSKEADKVIITTDDDRIYNHCLTFTKDIIKTSSDCRNGTERVFEATLKIEPKPQIVINLQGDAALTPPWILDEIISQMRNDRGILIGTPAVKMSFNMYLQSVNDRKNNIVGSTFVTFNKNFDALYFSKNIIPNIRDCERIDKENLPFYKHLGIYGYRYRVLERLVQLSESNLEKCEKLEQLRALENDISIKIILTNLKNRSIHSVDNPNDIKIVEGIINKEGELIDEINFY